MNKVVTIGVFLLCCIAMSVSGQFALPLELERTLKEFPKIYEQHQQMRYGNIPEIDDCQEEQSACEMFLRVALERLMVNQYNQLGIWQVDLDELKIGLFDSVVGYDSRTSIAYNHHVDSISLPIEIFCHCGTLGELTQADLVFLPTKDSHYPGYDPTLARAQRGKFDLDRLLIQRFLLQNYQHSEVLTDYQPIRGTSSPTNQELQAWFLVEGVSDYASVVVNPYHERSYVASLENYTKVNDPSDLRALSSRKVFREIGHASVRSVHRQSDGESFVTIVEWLLARPFQPGLYDNYYHIEAWVAGF